MTLREKQSLFARLLPRLIDHIYDEGYEITFGEIKRSVAQADANSAAGRGIANSLHLISLAIDINLFLEGKFLPETEAHMRFGTYWKQIHPLCRWGGDFKPSPDGNHYSLEHNGVK